MYYTAEKLGEGFYRIGSPEAVYMYVVEGKEKALLFDTGYGFGDTAAAVRSVTEKPPVIVNSHGHCDHTGGNFRFPQPAYLSPLDFVLARRHNSPQMRRDNACRARRSRNYETGEEFNGLPEDFDEEAYCRAGAGDLLPLTDDQIFDLGGQTLQVIPTPGHTKGSISLYWRERNLCLIGDATGFFVWLFAEETADLKTYAESVERLRDLHADGYFGGHPAEPAAVSDLDLYLKAAREADYETGVPFRSPYASDAMPRLCALGGKGLDEMFQPGFAAVVIGKNKSGK